MRFAAVVLLAVSACSSPPETGPPEASSDGALVGTVLSVDLSPMAYDGDAEIEMETDAGETVSVRIPARINLCEAEEIAQLDRLRPGDRIEVVGARDAAGAVRPCAQPEHRLVRVGAASGGAGLDVWEGYYVSGFETSSFRPCGGGDTGWWLTPDADLNERYAALQSEPGGRGLGPHVRVRFEGERSEWGRHGHLGAYPYEIRVARLLSIEPVADGDGEWPAPDC